MPRAAVMSTPGAVMSGLSTESPSRGPRLENGASSSVLVTAPTVRAAHSSAVMILSSCMGVVPSGLPSGPVERRWISERTK